ncbi:MAG TPA: NAD(P)H-dependent oxidoreductase [Flavobacteriaceae bacterium]|nr:NAD(P)H-dependent oxidoreductase [Flavobacteriaceae bacterium]HEX5743355.1 NAD(P)H-dependent oxidoreductase [Flavobacteriaceae bacterium]
MKHLVIVTHPNIENSIINKAWINELNLINDQVTIHQLYKEYPDYKIDIQKEQEMILAHDNIIFQFPLHWFNIPFFLKKWIDEVMAYGWAFGPNGDNLKNKKIRFAVSTGGDADAYASGNSIDELLKSLSTTFLYCGSEILPSHLFYGAGKEPNLNEINKNAKSYVKIITE